MTKAEFDKAVEKNMKIGMSYEEAYALAKDDEEVDKMTMGELKAEMGAEQWAIMKEMSKTGTKKTKKSPTTYKFDTKKHKKDDEKENFIAKLAEMLPNLAENVQIVNENREISFNLGENSYSLCLTKHRAPKNSSK